MAFAQTEPSWSQMTTRTLNLDGLVIHPPVEPGTQVFAFSTVFRSGCLESVRHMGHAHLGDEVIPSSVLATFVRSIIEKFARGAVQHGFAGPAIVAVSVLRVQNVRLGLGDRYSQRIAPSADRRDLLLPETWIGALDGFTDVDPIVRPLLDML